MSDVADRDLLQDPSTDVENPVALAIADTPIVTFYSYKGGVGRSMALANLAVVLARDYSMRVVTVDWDMEAPGLHRFFDVDDEQLEHGLIDYLVNYKERMRDRSSPIKSEDLSIKPYLREVRNFREKGSVSLMGAGSLRDHSSYAKKVNEFDWEDFYSRWQGAQMIEFFRHELKESADFVLIDSRTGITDFGSICTLQLPDIVVLVFVYNQQNLDGIDKVALDLTETNPILEKINRRPEILLLPSRKEISEITQLRKWERDTAKRLRKYVSSERALDRYSDAVTYLQDSSVPYVPYFAYGERIAVEIPEGVELRGSFEVLARNLVGEPGARFITPRDLEAVLKSHSGFLSSRRGSKLAKLAGYDLRSLREDVNLERATLSGSRLDGISLRGANFLQAELRGARLAGSDLSEANFAGADLAGADLAGADLAGANLSGTDLVRANLREAKLRRANLKDATGLTFQQLGGADLSGATLPKRLLDDQKEDSESFDQVRYAARLVRLVFLGLVGAAVGSLVFAFRISDLDLVRDRIGTAASGPSATMIYLGLATLLVYLFYLYRDRSRSLIKTLEGLPAVFPGGQSTLQIVSVRGIGQILGLLELRVPLRRLKRLRFFARYAGEVLAFSSLLVLWVRYLPRQAWVGTGLLVLLFGVAVAFAVETERGAEKSSMERRIKRTARMLRAGSAATLALGVLSFAALAGVRPDIAYLSPVSQARTPIDPRLWVPRVLSAVGLSPFARVVSETHNQIVLRGASLRAADLSGSTFVEGDFRSADMRGARLVGTSFEGAILEGVDLSFSLQEKANLTRAVLKNANLSGASLTSAVLTGADLEGVNLADASLRGADLTSCNLAGANLTNTDLRGANLEGAIGLTREQLKNAFLDIETRLQRSE